MSDESHSLRELDWMSLVPDEEIVRTYVGKGFRLYNYSLRVHERGRWSFYRAHKQYSNVREANGNLTRDEGGAIAIDPDVFDRNFVHDLQRATGWTTDVDAIKVSGNEFRTERKVDYKAARSDITVEIEAKFVSFNYDYQGATYYMKVEIAAFKDPEVTAEEVNSILASTLDSIDNAIALTVRQRNAKNLATLNVSKARKGLALPPELLREVATFLQPIGKKPYPGHEERLSKARSTIAKERQENLEMQRRAFLETLSPEEREAAYAAMGGKKRSKKRSNMRSKSKKPSKRSK
jgi:hypothetical protein